MIAKLSSLWYAYLEYELWLTGTSSLSVIVRIHLITVTKYSSSRPKTLQNFPASHFHLTFRPALIPLQVYFVRKSDDLLFFNVEWYYLTHEDIYRDDWIRGGHLAAYYRFLPRIVYLLTGRLKYQEVITSRKISVNSILR